MKTSILALAAIGAAFALPPVSLAGPPPKVQVDVTYVSPENFSDFKDSFLETEKGREWLESQLTAHLKKMAQDLVPAGTKLEVKFTDINLAGEYEPQRGPRFDDVRIFREIYPPRMTLQFRLLDADGKEIARGERRIIDTNFQFNAAPYDNDPLRYDKVLLTDWLRTEFRKKA